MILFHVPILSKLHHPTRSVPLFWSGQVNDSDGIETIAAKKKGRVLLRLLPVTFHLTDAVWRHHLPPSFQTSYLRQAIPDKPPLASGIRKKLQQSIISNN